MECASLLRSHVTGAQLQFGSVTSLFGLSRASSRLPSTGVASTSVAVEGTGGWYAGGGADFSPVPVLLTFSRQALALCFKLFKVFRDSKGVLFGDGQGTRAHECIYPRACVLVYVHTYVCACACALVYACACVCLCGAVRDFSTYTHAHASGRVCDSQVQEVKSRNVL